MQAHPKWAPRFVRAKARPRPRIFANWWSWVPAVKAIWWAKARKTLMKKAAVQMALKMNTWGRDMDGHIDDVKLLLEA